jgi:hypothetical protein
MWLQGAQRRKVKIPLSDELERRGKPATHASSRNPTPRCGLAEAKLFDAVSEERRITEI